MKNLLLFLKKIMPLVSQVYELEGSCFLYVFDQKASVLLGKGDAYSGECLSYYSNSIKLGS
jgi:hypothetical protein